MSESNNPKPIAEVIGEELETLKGRYPEYTVQIIAYADGISRLINKTIQTSTGKNANSYMDEICAQLDFVEKNDLAGLPVEIQRYVSMMRGLVREQIQNGKVELGKVPVITKKRAGSIEEAIILAETQA